MLTQLYEFFEPKGTWPIVAVLLVAYVFLNHGFTKRTERLGSENELLDGKRWYSAATAHELLGSLGEKGRSYYWKSELTLDLVFPLVYGSFFCILLARLYGPDRPWALLIPVLAVVADVLENGTIAYLAWSWSGDRSPLGWLAGALTSTKNGLLLLTLLILVVGILGVRQGVRS